MADFVQCINEESVSSRKVSTTTVRTECSTLDTSYIHPRIPKLPPRDVHKTPIEEHGKLQVVGSEAHRRELKSLNSHIGKVLLIDVSWEARRNAVLSNRIE